MYFQGFTPAQVAHTNTLLANTCLPVVGDLTWPSVCRMAPSFTGNEPYSFLGAAPYMTAFTGTVPTNAVQSFKMTVPNQVWVNSTDISIFDLWAYQTAGTIAGIASQFGLSTVWNPEYLLYYSLLNGRNAGSQSIKSPFDGNTYTTTADGLPIFSDSHPTFGSSSTFSNIIRGSGPGTQATMNSNGIIATAQSYWADLQAVTAAAQTAMNTNGAPLFPTLNPAKNLVVIAPSQIGFAMNLALRTEGFVDMTTNIGPEYHRNLIINGLASSCPHINQGPNGTMINPGARVTAPVYPSTTTPQLEYYVMVTGWTTGAAYMQLFNPLSQNQTFPGNYNPVEQIDRLVKDAGLSPAVATSMALSLVQTNFQFLSTQSDAQVMKTKQVTVAGTQLASLFFPWAPLIYRVIPSGGTA